MGKCRGAVFVSAVGRNGEVESLLLGGKWELGDTVADPEQRV